MWSMYLNLLGSDKKLERSQSIFTPVLGDSIMTNMRQKETLNPGNRSLR